METYSLQRSLVQLVFRLNQCYNQSARLKVFSPKVLQVCLQTDPGSVCQVAFHNNNLLF